MGKNPNTKSKKTVVVISVVASVIVVCIALISCLLVMAQTDDIYYGISVGSVGLGGMDREAATAKLESEYTAEHINVAMECDGNVFSIDGATYSLKPDYAASVEKAVSEGKDSSLVKRMLNVLKLLSGGKNIDLVISCDYDVLQYAINEHYADKVMDVQQHTVEFGENELMVYSGKAGKCLSVQTLLDKISKELEKGKLPDTIKTEIVSVEPDMIDIDKFIKEYNRGPEDAYINSDGGEIVIVPEVVGVSINSAEARSIISANMAPDCRYVIPAKITYPEVTAEQLEAEFTDTVIASYSSDYSTSSGNRKTNISLASSKINGLTLNPGEVFSFNDIVGPRTLAAGYKIAHVYSGSKVVDGVGGGICQVSSTLYNAVVFADLEIVYRRNHSIPVSYVPLGRDATVSYGTIDFKFKNNKESPVKFEVIPDGRRLTVNIYGAKKYLKDISVETAIVGTIPFSTSTIKVDTMYEDEKIVDEKGSNGTKVESYKVVKENGVVTSRTLLARSNYNPIARVEKVGTLKRESITEPVVQETRPDSEDTLPVQGGAQEIVPDSSVSASEQGAVQTPDPEVDKPDELLVSDSAVTVTE